jgi:hypothetical protein
MKLNKGVIIVEPCKKQENIFDGEQFTANKGVVLHIADDVQFVDPGDTVIFFTIKPMIEEHNWYVLEENEILVKL